MIKTVTDDTFQNDVLDSDTPVLVDFWAAWCGPCKAVAPILEEISNEYDIDVVKVNVDENPVTASANGISAIPTLNVYQGGTLVKQVTGAKPKGVLLKELADYI